VVGELHDGSVPVPSTGVVGVDPSACHHGLVNVLHRSVAILVAVLVCSGCGGENEMQWQKSDPKKLEGLVITKDDLPAWFSSETPEEYDRAFFDRLNACAGLPPLSEEEVAFRAGDEFFDLDTNVSSDAYSVKSPEALQQAFIALAAESTFPCVANELNTYAFDVQNGARDALGRKFTTTVGAIPNFVNGPTQLGLRFRTEITGIDKSTWSEAFTDVIRLREDRFTVTLAVATSLTSSQYGSTWEVEDSVVSTTKQRLAKLAK
jgi:hypothetical protein